MRLRLLFTLFCLNFSLLTLAQPLAPKREFRAVWIATVNNIDWPSRSGLSSEEQQQEFIELLDQHRSIGINAVIVQIRPAGDAFYNSSYEPWSKWLTGEAGKAPEPYYDPLEFMVRETHKRHLEFHAWVNPFRVSFRYGSGGNQKMANYKPSWFLTYGSYRMFNPGISEVRTYLTSVMKDIVTRYNIDGLHFDDYFYPYPDLKQELGDRYTFHRNKRGFRKISDWRRDNINLFIKGVHTMLQQYAPRVKFGVSPFGVWRNQRDDPMGSPTRSGYTSYDHLYADVRLWLKEGWIDYVAPQCYQSTRHFQTPFAPLVNWWNKNSFDRHIYIGHAVYRLFSTKNDTRAWYSKLELPNQIRSMRNLTAIKGSVFFSSNTLLKNKGGSRDSLKTNFYHYPALVPVMPWKDSIPPNPLVEAHWQPNFDGNKITWNMPEPAEDGEYPRSCILYRFRKDEKLNLENPARILAILPANKGEYLDNQIEHNDLYRYFLTSVDRLQNESIPVEVTEDIPEATANWGLPFSQETAADVSDYFIKRMHEFITPMPYEIVDQQ